MKISRGFVKEAFKVIEKETGRKYDCFLQDYEWSNGEHTTRYNIGINGWNEWNFLHYEDEDSFNEHYDLA